MATHIWNEGRIQHPSLQALEVHVPEEGVPLDLSSPFLLAAQPLLRVFGEQLQQENPMRSCGWAFPSAQRTEGGRNIRGYSSRKCPSSSLPSAASENSQSGWGIEVAAEQASVTSL